MTARSPDEVFAEIGPIFDERMQLDNLSGEVPAQDVIVGEEPVVAESGTQVAMGGATRV